VIWILAGGIPLVLGFGWFLWHLRRRGELWEFLGVVGGTLAAIACFVAFCYGVQQVHR
jgi:hypothetical protein